MRRAKWRSIDELADVLYTIFANERDTATTTTVTSASSTAAAVTTPQSAIKVERFTLINFHPEADFLEASSTLGETTFIAKPWSLRISVFDGSTKNITGDFGNQANSTLTIAYTYSTNKRQRTVSTRFSNIETQYTQSITPSYFAGSIIYAARIPGGTDVMRNGANLDWLDLNTDGRHWSYDGNFQIY